jgi:hypothetical protein
VRSSIRPEANKKGIHCIIYWARWHRVYSCLSWTAHCRITNIRDMTWPASNIFLTSLCVPDWAQYNTLTAPLLAGERKEKTIHTIFTASPFRSASRASLTSSPMLATLLNWIIVRRVDFICHYYSHIILELWEHVCGVYSEITSLQAFQHLVVSYQSYIFKRLKRVPDSEVHGTAPRLVKVRDRKDKFMKCVNRTAGSPLSNLRMDMVDISKN